MLCVKWGAPLTTLESLHTFSLYVEVQWPPGLTHFTSHLLLRRSLRACNTPFLTCQHSGGEPGLWLPWLRKGHLYQTSESIRATTTEHTSPDGFSSADIDSHSSEAGSLKWRHLQTLHLVRTASWFVVPWSSLCVFTQRRGWGLSGVCVTRALTASSCPTFMT